MKHIPRNRCSSRYRHPNKPVLPIHNPPHPPHLDPDIDMLILLFHSPTHTHTQSHPAMPKRLPSDTDLHLSDRYANSKEHEYPSRCPRILDNPARLEQATSHTLTLTITIPKWKPRQPPPPSLKCLGAEARLISNHCCDHKSINFGNTRFLRNER